MKIHGRYVSLFTCVRFAGKTKITLSDWSNDNFNILKGNYNNLIYSFTPYEKAIHLEVVPKWEIASYKKPINNAYDAISALVFLAIPMVIQWVLYRFEGDFM